MAKSKVKKEKKEIKKAKVEQAPEKAPQPFDIFAHELVPKHEILSKEEAEEVLTKFHVKPYKLPHIKASDPAVKAIGGKPGDIIKITRKSPTAGYAFYYRYVVP
jgi:DNA-directed RNA polymerase subunit H